MSDSNKNRDFQLHYKQGVLIAVLLALLCVTVEYGLGNNSYSLFDSSTHLSTIGWLRREHNAMASDSGIIKINVAYDKAFADVPHPAFAGVTVGTRPITDRHKLLQFMKLIEGTEYRYLFMDLRFEKQDSTPFDKELFAMMLRAPHFSISTHHVTPNLKYEIADSSLLQCAGYSDYGHYVFDNFSHYETIQQGEPSVALRMYRDLCGGDISGNSLFWTSGGRLCNKSIFLTLADIETEERENRTVGGKEFNHQDVLELVYF